MIFGSVCSGIEAASVAWHPMGWRAAFVSEIEKFPCAVLAHHYPTVPNLGDMTKYQEWPDANLDVLVGGTPCQSFSVAGLRKGLGDPRGNLMLTYGAIAGRYRPRWLVWENVPGVLSSNGGRDFGTFLGMLAELGYGFAYRVLDAQYIRVDGFARAVPQRRRRVFVVGCLGDWRRAAAVLFERESLCGHPAPSRQAREGSSSGIARSLAIRGRDGTPQAELGEDVANAILTPSGGRAGIGCGAAMIAMAHGQGGAEITTGYSPSLTCNHEAPIVAHAIQAGALRENPNSGPDGVGVQEGIAYTLEARAEVQAVAHSLRGEGFDASEDGTGRGTPLVATAIRTANTSSNGHGFNDEVAYTLDRTQGQAVAFAHQAGGIQTTLGYDPDAGTSPTLAKCQTPAITTGMAVRRLTPTECERLQGFPDGYTDIRHGGKPTPDGCRYKALGNSMAVNAMRWIGQRIALVDQIGAVEAAA